MHPDEQLAVLTPELRVLRKLVDLSQFLSDRESYRIRGDIAELFSDDFTEDQYDRFFMEAPEYSMCTMLAKMPNYRVKIVEGLLSRAALENRTLLAIIEHAPDFTERAWERLVNQNPTDDELQNVLFSSNSTVAHKAAELLLQNKHLDETELMYITRQGSEDQKAEAAERILRNTTSRSVALRFIVLEVPSHADRAWSIMNTRVYPTITDLDMIAEVEHSPFAERARQKAAELKEIFKETPDEQRHSY